MTVPDNRHDMCNQSLESVKKMCNADYSYFNMSKALNSYPTMHSSSRNPLIFHLFLQDLHLLLDLLPKRQLTKPIIITQTRLP